MNSENLVNEIRRYNLDIQEKISELKKAYGDDPIESTKIEKILESQQKYIMSMYLAEFKDFTYDKSIIDKMGVPVINKFLNGGLDHKNHTVVLRDMDKDIEMIKSRKDYGSNPHFDSENVIDDGSYLNYMIVTGGKSIDHYETLLPHELRHLFGVAGNSDFETQKGFAEGKTELDTRRVMEKYGYNMYLDRNYSPEALFVEYLEDKIGKDEIDRLGSFKQLEYIRLADKYGRDAVDEYLSAIDVNSTKKDFFINMQRQDKEVSHDISEIINPMIGKIDEKIKSGGNIENISGDEIVNAVVNELVNKLGKSDLSEKKRTRINELINKLKESDLSEEARVCAEKLIAIQRKKDNELRSVEEKYPELMVDMDRIGQERDEYAEKIFSKDYLSTKMPEEEAKNVAQTIEYYRKHFDNVHTSMEANSNENKYENINKYKEAFEESLGKTTLDTTPDVSDLELIINYQLETMRVIEEIISEREQGTLDNNHTTEEQGMLTLQEIGRGTTPHFSQNQEAARLAINALDERCNGTRKK